MDTRQKHAADPSLASVIAEQHLACRLFDHVEWTEDRIALALQDDLVPQLPPALTRSPFDGLEALQADISHAALDDPTFVDITIEPIAERLVSGMMTKMDPRNQEKDIRKVIRRDMRMRQGGRKEYGGDVPPYPLRDRPLLPPMMTRRANSALPHLGPLRGQVLRTIEQLTEKGRFQVVQPVKLVQVKEPDFDRDAAAGQKIVVNPQLISAAKAWRKPLIKSFVRAMQAHDYELERMPRWKEWERKSARQIKESTAKAHLPLMPRQPSYRPARHAYPVQPFDVSLEGLTEAKAELEDTIFEGLLEAEAYGDAAWDDIQVPNGIEVYTKDPTLVWKEALREKDLGQTRRHAREMRWLRRQTDEAEQYPLGEADMYSPTLDQQHYTSPAGARAERYFYQHPQSSPFSYNASGGWSTPPTHTNSYADRNGPLHTPQHDTACMQRAARPGPPHMPKPMAQARPPTSVIHGVPKAKRKHWSETADLRQLALRRKVPSPDHVPQTDINRSYDARAHLDEQRFLLAGVVPRGPSDNKQYDDLDKLDEPELDEEEALLARRKREDEERIAAELAAAAPVDLSAADLANPQWYRKACYVARTLETRAQPLPVLASLQLFQHRPLVSALEAQGLVVMDEEAYLGGADLVPWATVGILFRPLAPLGEAPLYESLIKALRTAALYYERVLLVLEVQPNAAGAEGDLVARMEALEEEDDPLRAVMEPRTPKKSTGANVGGGRGPHEGINGEQGGHAVSSRVQVSPATRQALARLRRHAATFAGSTDGPIEKIATKIDILFATDGVDEVSGAIRALAEHEEAKRLGALSGDRVWLQVEQTSDEHALIETFYLNPFAARLVLNRHQPLDRFISETDDGEIERQLTPLTGARAAKRFLKILQEEKRMRQQRQVLQLRQQPQREDWQGETRPYSPYQDTQYPHPYPQEQLQYYRNGDYH